MIFNLLEGTGTGAEGGANAGGGSGITTIIIMVVMVVAIIGLFVWQSISNKKKQKEAQKMVDSIKVGDRVKTIGGICGFIAEINDADNTFVLETGLSTNKCYVRFDRGAIYQTAPNNAGQKEEIKALKVEEKPAEEPVKKTAKKSTKKAQEKKEIEPENK